MFKNLFKKSTKEAIVPCACDSNNEHCDLILQLRNCQDLKKNIQNEIRILNDDCHMLLGNFVKLLERLEENGLRSDSFYSYMKQQRNTRVIEYTIQDYSSADIIKITEELKTYKNKEEIICEKQRALKAVEDDIENIKTKLGIT